MLEEVLAPYIQTVTGRVAPDSIGFTLPHEHTYIDLWSIPGRWDYHHTIPDEELLVSELNEFKKLGGSCIVELTVPGIGRDPLGIKRLSELTGLFIVMGSGWYRQPYYPPEARIDQRTSDELAEEIVHDFHEGVGTTGIKPGIIGEIGADKKWVSAQEERVCRAVARAHRATGLALTTHSVYSDVGLAQLRIFEEEGADPSRVVIGHADSYPFLDYYLRVIERGASIAFDSLGQTPIDHYEPRLIGLICELLHRGLGNHLLLSQDTCHTRHLKAFHGNGYSYVAETFLPRLRAAGVPEDAIRQITVDNPKRILQLK